MAIVKPHPEKMIGLSPPFSAEKSPIGIVLVSGRRWLNSTPPRFFENDRFAFAEPDAFRQFVG